MYNEQTKLLHSTTIKSLHCDCGNVIIQRLSDLYGYSELMSLVSVIVPPELEFLDEQQRIFYNLHYVDENSYDNSYKSCAKMCHCTQQNTILYNNEEHTDTNARTYVETTPYNVF
jgi:hypothetical protein